MTFDELEYMAKCAHRSACERLVTLHAPLDDNSFWWCRCKTCPNYSVDLRSFNIAMLEASVEYLRKENIDWEDTYRELAGRYTKLSALCIDMFAKFVMEHGSEDDIHEYRSRLHDLGIEADK